MNQGHISGQVPGVFFVDKESCSKTFLKIGSVVVAEFICLQKFGPTGESNGFTGV